MDSTSDFLLRFVVPEISQFKNGDLSQFSKKGRNFAVLPKGRSGPIQDKNCLLWWCQQLYTQNPASSTSDHFWDQVLVAEAVKWLNVYVKGSIPVNINLFLLFFGRQTLLWKLTRGHNSIGLCVRKWHHDFLSLRPFFSRTIAARFWVSISSLIKTWWIQVFHAYD